MERSLPMSRQRQRKALSLPQLLSPRRKRRRQKLRRSRRQAANAGQGVGAVAGKGVTV